MPLTPAIGPLLNNTNVFISIFIITSVLYIYVTFQNPLSQVPGPWYSRWTSWVLKYHWFKGQRAFYVHSLHQKYGPIVRLSPSEIDVSEIACVKRIHSIKGGYLKSSWYTDVSASATETIFNTADVEFHRKHRRLLSGPLSESSLRHVAPFISEKVELAILKMKEEMKVRGATDVFKWWLFMATDIIGELSFGESFRMLDIGQKTGYISFLEGVAQTGAIRSTFPGLVKRLALLPIPALRRAAETGQKIASYAEESIQRYKRQMLADPENQKPMLFKNLFLAGEDGRLSDEEISGEAQAYIIAGSDTTSNTLTWLVWSVCNNPKIMDMLVSELQTLDHDHIDIGRLSELPYLNQVIDETLRLYSPVPSALPRVVPPMGADMAGYFIPGTMTVSTQAYTLHRNPDIFPRPEVFDPLRWKNPTKSMKEAFMPFGGGSRSCIGIHLARMELRLASALFFLHFPKAKVSTMEGMSNFDMQPRIYFLASPQGKRCLIQLS